MFTAKRVERCASTSVPRLLTAMFLVTILASLVPAAAQAVTVRAVSQSVQFASATTVTVQIALEEAVGVAGLQFSIDYPSTLIATENLTTHVDGQLFGLLAVNHDATGGANPPEAGFRRISVSAAQAENLTTNGGVLLTLDFEVGCAGFAQDFPEGRGVTLDVRDLLAFDENGADIAATAVDGTLTLDCTTVGVDDSLTFGTIKAHFDAKRED